MTVSILGLDRADVLAALYNASQPLGFGHLAPASQTAMTRDQAAAYLADGHTYFDYLQGRVLKVDLSGDDVDPRLYDRDNGPGACARVIAALRTDADRHTAA